MAGSAAWDDSVVHLGAKLNAAAHADDVARRCYDALATGFSEFGPLPSAKSLELYLIRCLQRLPDGSHQVYFPPEFMFVAELGRENLAGVSVPWVNVGAGDPDFPDFTRASFRSIPRGAFENYLYPNIAGRIAIGIAEGTSEAEIRSRLAGEGLKDVDVSNLFVSASCRPFEESAVCKEIQDKFPFVAYAEPAKVVRIIDQNPGWFIQRLT